MDSKNILQSKTLWANLIALVAVLLGAHNIDLDADTQTQLVATILVVVNIVLRFVTKQPVHVLSPPPLDLTQRADPTPPPSGSTGSGTISGVVLLIAGAALACALTACVGPAPLPPSAQVVLACDSYASGLLTLSAARANGKLSDAQVADVDALRATINPLCSGDVPPDPVSATATIRSAANRIALIQAGVKP